VYLHL